MTKSLLLSLISFISFNAYGADFPKPGNIEGHVIHNINSSSELYFTDGSWNNCKKSTCELAGAFVTVGSKKIELTEGHYFEQDASGDNSFYILRGKINVGSTTNFPVTRDVSFKFIFNKKDGTKRGYLKVNDLALQEQIVVN